MFPVVKSYCVILARNLPYYEPLLLYLITKILLLKNGDCKNLFNFKRYFQSRVTTTTSTIEILIKHLLHYLKPSLSLGSYLDYLTRDNILFQKPSFVAFYFVLCQIATVLLTLDTTWLFCMRMYASWINGLVFLFL